MEEGSGGATSHAVPGFEEAERLVLRWEPSSPSPSDDGPPPPLFNGDTALYLRAFDEIRLSSTSSPSSFQIAMARLEDEFRRILASLATDPVRYSADLSDGGSSAGSEAELLPSFAGAAVDLRGIAERMVEAGYARECVQAYAGARKAAVDAALRALGIERIGIGDVQRLEWEALEARIPRWIRAARSAVRAVFARERRLADLVFPSPIADHLPSPDSPFLDSTKPGVVVLLSFPEAVGIGRRSPEKLFRMIDLHDALLDLLPDLATLFPSGSPASIHNHATEILARTAEAVRGTLSEFENAVLRDPSRTPVPGGTIHPLTRYVMNYISLISDYKDTLVELIHSRPSMTRLSPPGDDSATTLPLDMDFLEFESRSSLSSHMIWIIAILEHNLETKAGLYKDAALTHLFLMNNAHYIVQKTKDSSELRGLIGDEFLKSLARKYHQSATSYQRTTWVKVLHCLRDEGIHVSGSLSYGVSKSILRERFKDFNLAFEEAHRTQSSWQVPDLQLREELRISISEKLVPAYRSFLGRFRNHIESGKNPDMYIKYSVEDLEEVLLDFFEGSHPSLSSKESPFKSFLKQG